MTRFLAGWLLSFAVLGTGFLDEGNLAVLAPHRPGGRVRVHGDPFELVDRESLMTTLGELSAIGSDGLWRNSASAGEARARSYVRGRLEQLQWLVDHGLEIRVEPFRTFLAAEAWQTGLELEVAGSMLPVPAHAIPGHRSWASNALLFDTDGELNDDRRDPVTTRGAAALIRSDEEIRALEPGELEGRVVLLDYAVIDRSVRNRADATAAAVQLLRAAPSALVVVTSFSNAVGASHGSFVGDTSVLTLIDDPPPPPSVYVRLEDLSDAGLDSWARLAAVTSARLVVDLDVFSPGTSANVVARVPGVDPTRAVIVGAHLDSPNSPGALDDGSGSAALIEVARVLDAARVRPPVDLYLVWYGSHERGLFGSTSFTAAHSELLDRTAAVLQLDCLTRPLNGYSAWLNIEAWSYGRFGDGRLPWPESLESLAAARGVTAVPLDYRGLASDNSSYGAFDVPNANLIFMDTWSMSEIHYDGHLHDPYDTAELAADEIGTLEEMVVVALGAAVEAGEHRLEQRVTPPRAGRAVLVASHTESPHMSLASSTDLGMTLAWEGLDVDVVPYGRHVIAADLAGVDLVVVLPVHDYPAPGGDTDAYDEAWSAAEVEVLEDYVGSGGTLVLTNSAHRLKYYNQVYEENEDRGDQNRIALRFGVRFLGGRLSGDRAQVVGADPLVDGVSELELARDNGVPFSLERGVVLAAVDGAPAVAVVDDAAGGGRVVVLADLGILATSGDPVNLPFWRNLAQRVLGH